MKLSGRSIAFIVVLALAVLLPFTGKGGLLAGLVIGAALIGAPLFVLLGVATISAFALWSGFSRVGDYTDLMEAIRSLADSPTLLAIPFFMMSGAIMSKGQISARLIDFALAFVGWIPGGLAMSAVVSCMLFAAISGSSPATVVAIGSMMGPTLIAAGYEDKFAHGLVTSAGSLGILIPPSIPMIVYPIVNQGEFIEVERLFAAGVGPGIVMGSILIGFCFYHGLRDKASTTPFAFKHMLATIRDGFWALLFPVLILGGIYGGIFNAVEAAAASVVYAVVVEVWLHRALVFKQIPAIFQETGILLGALLVIMVMALAFGEFLEKEEIPTLLVEWLQEKDLKYWQFLVMLNLMLFMVGMLMDILSAMFIFVPLLAPIATSMGVDPIHFGIIFIVNLEIGYLTPPVGLNLFVSSALFQTSFGHIVKSVAPFIVLMIFGLGLITWIPGLSVGLGNWIMGAGGVTTTSEQGDEEDEEDEESATMPSMQEMMREAARAAGEDADEDEEDENEEGENEEDDGDEGDKGEFRMPSMKEMMKEADLPDEE